MAWRSSGASNADLVANLSRNGLIRSARVRDAMLAVDRAHFCPPAAAAHAYVDAPQPIGSGATISAPHMHAAAAEALLPAITASGGGGGVRVLDVGSGSGYLTALLAELAPAAVVVGLDHLPALADLARRNVAADPRRAHALASGRLRFVVADGRRGWRDPDLPPGADAAWDAIHVGAAAAELHPELVAQLRCPGRMFIPIADGPGAPHQHVWIVAKDAAGRVTKEKLFSVMYVPLTDAPPHADDAA